MQVISESYACPDATVGKTKKFVQTGALEFTLREEDNSSQETNMDEEQFVFKEQTNHEMSRNH